MHSLLNLGSLVMCRFLYVADCGVERLMESGPARSVKEEAVGLPSLSVSGVVSQDQTVPLVWVFRPVDTRGTFGSSNIWVGNQHRNPWAIPLCEGQCLGVLHMLWSQESLVSSRTILKKRH